MAPPTARWNNLREVTLEQLWNPVEVQRRWHPEDRFPAPRVTHWRWSQHQLQIRFTGPWRVHTLWSQPWDDGPYQKTQFVTDYTCAMTIDFTDNHPEWSALRCDPMDVETDATRVATRHLAYILEHSGLSALAEWIHPTPPPATASPAPKMAEGK